MNYLRKTIEVTSLVVSPADMNGYEKAVDQKNLR